MSSYKVLNQQVFTEEGYSIVPIRMQDRFDIMQWRNEQMYHLRQSEPLTKEKQDVYFEEVVSRLFDQKQPSQILFSFLKDKECIGYGGLVHINWIDRNAEISFVMKTELEKKTFQFHWINFLGLIERVAKDIQLHKIFTYAFDLRPKLYVALEKSGFYKEATLKDHCHHQNEFLDVIIHSKILSNNFKFREATFADAKLLFDWVNEENVRYNSLSNSTIEWKNHLKWFKSKLKEKQSHIFIFFLNNEPIGQVRLDLENGYWVIDYSIDKNHRGKGLGTEILRKIVNLEKFQKFLGVVKEENIGSRKVFEKLGFEETEIKNESDSESKLFKYSYIKK